MRPRTRRRQSAPPSPRHPPRRRSPLAPFPPRPEPATPIALAYGNTGSGDDSTVSLQTLGALTGTRPWVRFIGVLMFIGIGINVLLILVALALSGGRLGFGWLSAGLTLLVTGLGIAPALQLNRYASRITRLTQSRSPVDLAAALRAQESFWRFVGIATLIVLLLYAAILAVLVATAIFA